MLRSRWLLFTIVVPTTAWLLSKVASQIERRRGPSSFTRAMHWPLERRRRTHGAAPA